MHMHSMAAASVCCTEILLLNPAAKDAHTFTSNGSYQGYEHDWFVHILAVTPIYYYLGRYVVAARSNKDWIWTVVHIVIATINMTTLVWALYLHGCLLVNL
jgi:hypothetical protein